MLSPAPQAEFVFVAARLFTDSGNSGSYHSSRPSDRSDCHRLRIKMVRRSKVISPANIHRLGCKPERTSLKPANIVHTTQKIARFTRLHGPLFNNVLVEDVFQAGSVQFNAGGASGAFEYFQICSPGWHLNSRPVTETPEKRFVDDLIFIKAGGEDHQLLERHFDLVAVIKSQK